MTIDWFLSVIKLELWLLKVLCSNQNVGWLFYDRIIHLSMLMYIPKFYYLDHYCMRSMCCFLLDEQTNKSISMIYLQNIWLGTYLKYNMYPKLQQTKMLVKCQRFGDLFLFGMVWQYSSFQTKYNKCRFKVMTGYLLAAVI